MLKAWLLLLSVSVSLGQVSLWGQSRAYAKASKIAVVSSCVASAFDGASTYYAIKRGAVETNPLFRGSGGGVKWGWAIGAKSGVCGLGFVLRRFSPRAATYVGFGQAAAFTYVGARNIRIGKESK